MRIIGGSHRGRSIHAPRTSLIRPTSDRVRETLFNRLGPMDEVSSFLDLYAGTGAVGLEALSRGADSALFVDASPLAVAAMQKNLTACGLEDRGRVLRGDVLSVLCSGLHRRPFDLVFADPPYGSLQPSDWGRILDALRSGWIRASTRVVLEQDGRPSDLAWLRAWDEEAEVRRTGRALLAVFRLQPLPDTVV